MPTVTLKSGRELEIEVDREEASGDGINQERHRASVQLAGVSEWRWTMEGERMLVAQTTPDEDQEIMAIVADWSEDHGSPVDD